MNIISLPTRARTLTEHAGESGAAFNIQGVQQGPRGSCGGLTVEDTPARPVLLPQQ